VEIFRQTPSDKDWTKPPAYYCVANYEHQLQATEQTYSRQIYELKVFCVDGFTLGP